MIKQQNSLFGILCFSATPNESVLWSHYADKHRGAVLEFEFESKSDVTKMEYPTERPTIDANIYARLQSDETQLKPYLLSLLKRLLRRKSPGWAYEQEYRVFFEFEKNQDLIASDGHYFKRIPDSFVTRVILGWRSPLQERLVADALAASGFTSTKVVRARMSLNTYEVQC